MVLSGCSFTSSAVAIVETCKLAFHPARSSARTLATGSRIRNWSYVCTTTLELISAARSRLIADCKADRVCLPVNFAVDVIAICSVTKKRKRKKEAEKGLCSDDVASIACDVALVPYGSHVVQKL